MLRKSLIIVLLCSISLVGCKSKKQVSGATAPKKEVVRDTPNKEVVVEAIEVEKSTPEEAPKYSSDPTLDYIETYKQFAMDDMLQYGIPASIKLAQGILESGSGRGELSRKANNHFGIKCHNWTGESVRHDDDELQECFRKYSHVKYSYRDHSLFLTQRSRYKNLFSLRKDDYKGWAKGLRQAGYATDPSYSNKLISLIERYQLHRYDAIVLNTSGEKIAESNTNTKGDKIETYTVKKGDTLYNISRRYNISVNALKGYNGITGDVISVGQELYLHAVN